MTIELLSLLVFTATIAAVLSVQATDLVRTQGWGYVVGNRAHAPEVASAFSARLKRTLHNSMEAAVIFVPLVLIAAHLDISNARTQAAAVVFAGARVVYSVLYAAGVTRLRTVVWNVGFVALFVFGFGLWPS